MQLAVPKRQQVEKGKGAMPDPVTRKRLKKKMLDRWENEGGSLGGDAAAEDRSTKEQRVRKGKQSAASRNNSTAGGPASSTKKRTSTRK